MDAERRTCSSDSVLQNHRPQLVLLTRADCSDGSVVELKGGPPVHHHAGVPAPRAHTHPESTERPVRTVRLTDPDRVALTDLLAKPLCRLLEKTRFTMGSRMLKRRRRSSGLKTSDSLYWSVTEHHKRRLEKALTWSQRTARTHLFL